MAAADRRAHKGSIVSDEQWTDPVAPIDPKCAAVRAEVWSLLDGDCTAELREVLLHHVDKCPRCMGYFRIETRINRSSRPKCCGDKPQNDWVAVGGLNDIDGQTHIVRSSMDYGALLSALSSKPAWQSYMPDGPVRFWFRELGERKKWRT